MNKKRVDFKGFWMLFLVLNLIIFISLISFGTVQQTGIGDKPIGNAEFEFFNITKIIGYAIILCAQLVFIYIKWPFLIKAYTKERWLDFINIIYENKPMIPYKVIQKYNTNKIRNKRIPNKSGYELIESMKKRGILEKNEDTGEVTLTEKARKDITKFNFIYAK